MKVLYANPMIAAYTHPVLERIVSRGCELVMLLPQNDDKTVGAGVKRAEAKKTSYRICYSRSKTKWYGKPALIDLKCILSEEKPDILMIGWPYFLHLFFDRSILKLIKKNKIRLIIQEIPFQTPPFGKLGYFKKHPVYNENMELQSQGLSFYLRAMLTMWIRRYIYKKADATVNYASCAYDILPSYGVKREDIFVRYNTSDTDTLFEQRKEVLSTPPILKICPRILHIGRLVKWKKVDLLVEAFQKISDKYPDAELVIIGDGPERETLEQQVSKLGLKDRTVFTGAIYDPLALGQYMHESSVYVLAGMGGLSINDAMCFSLPVICSVCDGTEKDLITDGVNGYIFQEGNVDSLAYKIDLVLSDKEKAKTMGEASYRVIKEKINLGTVSQRYLDAFSYVMDKT
ncbi:glycosyltransferase [Tannerella forsythia]|uniref:Glycosyltransferase family 1 protein n=1 Tax=Tannerella forsythia TaxID=28112 RepID=A0A3P1YVB1_TANFO|nr:glycosyltransferase [Tannerella forsythia]RRD74567.1 glycosyltransferase family 1 protein [Tannerella forsythia]